MFRKPLVLLASLVVLMVLLGTSAGQAQLPEHSFFVSGLIDPGKNHVDLVRYYISGKGVSEVRIYLVGMTSKYLKLSPVGSDRYQKTADGRIYWVRHNIPLNASPRSKVTVAVKVRTDIPLHVLHCIVTKATGSAPATETEPAWQEMNRPPAKYCMSGKQWLTPVIH